MKDLKKFLNNPLIFVIFASLATAMVMGLIAFILILPKAVEFGRLATQNRDDDIKLATLTQNIENFSKLNLSEVESFSKLVDELIPEENDVVRFITLNEIVAKASGVVVSDAKFTSGTSTQTQPSSGGGQSPTPSVQQQSSKGLFGTVYAQEAQTSQSQNQSVQTSGGSYDIKVSVTGNFENILNYISEFKKTDRLVGISEIAITSSDEGGEVNAVVEFVLPLSSSTAIVTPNESVVLSEGDRKLLQDLAGNIRYSAFPSEDPLGRSDPFK